MTLLDQLRDLVLILREAVGLLRELDTRLAATAAPVATATPAPSPGPAPVTPAPSTISVVASPRTLPPIGGPGRIPDEIWPVAQEAGKTYGVDWRVLVAIETWETGWYGGLEDWPSLAWRLNYNPGGMKNAPAQFAGIIETDRDDERPVYLRFKSWQDGIHGHALFLGRGPRYAKIHETSDPVAQIDAIGAAGYAEGSPEWVTGVKSCLAKIETLWQQRSGTSATWSPATAMSRAPDPFPYSPDTNGGRLGCAQTVTWALTQAGILTREYLSVDETESTLRSLGWVETSTPYWTDDVVFWAKGPSGHRHVGILEVVEGRLMLRHNRSSLQKVVCESLDEYEKRNQPHQFVLRRPR